MRLVNYMEQHDKIKKEINEIKNLLRKNNIENEAFEVSTHISRLAGIINIHLSSEDKYLYPVLIGGNDNNISNLAKEYQDEMGDLFSVFTNFKNEYNTKTKILSNVDSFGRELKMVVTKLEERMIKEENGLYKLID